MTNGNEYRNLSRTFFENFVQTVGNTSGPLWVTPQPAPTWNNPNPPWPQPPYQPPMMPAPSYGPDFRNGDSGYFFAPYVPMTQTPVILDHNSFNRNGIMTRYSRRLLREGERNYGRLVIDQNGTREEEYADRDEEQTVNWKKEGF